MEYFYGVEVEGIKAIFWAQTLHMLSKPFTTEWPSQLLKVIVRHISVSSPTRPGTACAPASATQMLELQVYTCN